MKMSASETVKNHGLKNLKQVAEATKQSTQTLGNWHKNKPELFEIVVLGTVEKMKNNTQ